MGEERWFDELVRAKHIPGDCGSSITEKPKWFDKEKYRKSKENFEDYSTGILLSHLLGTILMSQVKSLVETLLATGQHETIQSSIKRSTLTIKFVDIWYKGDLFDPEDKAHNNIKLVRSMHAKVSQKLNHIDKKETDGVWISQYDMALTQFAFIGALVRNPESLGVYCTDIILEEFLYFWRCVGYLLGMEDAYNICGRGLSELRILSQDIVDEVVLPSWSNPCEDYTRTIIYAFHGFAKVGVAISYSTMFNLTCDVIEKPKHKKELTFSQFLSYWFYRFSTSIMKCERLRKHFNKRHLQVSALRVEKVLRECESNDTNNTNNCKSVKLRISQWIFAFCKIIWSMLWKSYKTNN